LEKTKHFTRTRFSVDVLREAIDAFHRVIPTEEAQVSILHLVVEIDGARWKHDSQEEFFADYRRSSGNAVYDESLKDGSFRIQSFGNSVEVSIKAPERRQIEAVFDVFENYLSSSRMPEPPPQKPTIFIGHGRSQAWRDLKDHLQDKHGLSVEAYEIGARAGHVIRDILEDMLTKSSFAVLVMTAEDETVNGNRWARQNVIHEVGLFQGRLGFSRAIILLEEGTEEFSNISGIEQIRFIKGNIKETFGEVLATIKREFSEDAA